MLGMLIINQQDRMKHNALGKSHLKSQALMTN